jgi:cell wall-associated NlpC family hydrolase
VTLTRQPSPADFFLAPIPEFVGKTIQFGQFLNGEGFSEYQHAGILLDGGQTMEAMPGGAIIGHISRWKPEELRWSTGLIELTASQRLDIVHYARAREGVPYSFIDYGAIAAHRFHTPVPGLKSYIEDSGHQICSQMVDWVYAQADVHLFNDGRWPGYVTPNSLNILLDDIVFHESGF